MRAIIAVWVFDFVPLYIVAGTDQFDISLSTEIASSKGRRTGTKHTETAHVYCILHPSPTLRIFMWVRKCYFHCAIFKCSLLGNRTTNNILLAYDILFRSFNVRLLFQIIQFCIRNYIRIFACIYILLKDLST